MDGGCQSFAEVTLFQGHESDEDFGDRALVDMLNEEIESWVCGIEDVLHDLVLLAVDEQNQKFGEVAGQHWVDGGGPFHELEKTVQKLVLRCILLFVNLGASGRF